MPVSFILNGAVWFDKDIQDDNAIKTPYGDIVTIFDSFIALIIFY